MDKAALETLFGGGLIRVHTPEMVSRYNDALQRIGVEPSKLESFDVDGAGWSPQIAVEKGEPLYPFEGDATRCIIILTPDQMGKPIYFPYASYERSLLLAFWKRYQREIADITLTHPMVLALDQEITQYETPLDLLLGEVVVKADTEGLMEAADDQKKLVAAIMDGEDEDGWMNEELRSRLAESAKAHGDLRRRHVSIPDFVYDDCECFFTEAFGGVFVLRTAGRDTVLVVERQERTGLDVPSTPQEGVRIISLTDPALPALLIEEKYAALDLTWYAANLDALQDIRECLAAKIATEAQPDLPWQELSSERRKRVLAMLPKGRLTLLGELERLRRRLGKEPSLLASAKDLSPELTLLLLRSAGKRKSARNDSRAQTVSMLLARLRSHDPLELYRADKNRYNETQKNWPAAYRKWAEARIRERYHPVMLQPIEKE